MLPPLNFRLRMMLLFCFVIGALMAATCGFVYSIFVSSTRAELDRYGTIALCEVPRVRSVTKRVGASVLMRTIPQPGVDLCAYTADQFDLVVHLDRTHALEPLERRSEWEAGELPETYPWGV